MKTALIAAISENHVIGKDNQLPWDLPKDWENFKKVTAGKAFIMGRHSHESPHALHSDYKNVILSRQESIDLPGSNFYHATNLNAALDLLKKEELVFILGGAEVFAQAIDKADFLYLTVVHHSFNGDAFFPSIDWQQWRLLQSDRYEIDQRHLYPFSIQVYQRK